MTKITTLNDYGVQRSLTRQRIYQLQRKLNVVEAQIFALIDGEYVPTGKTQKFVVEKKP